MYIIVYGFEDNTKDVVMFKRLCLSHFKNLGEKERNSLRDFYFNDPDFTVARYRKWFLEVYGAIRKFNDEENINDLVKRTILNNFAKNLMYIDSK